MREAGIEHTGPGTVEVYVAPQGVQRRDSLEPHGTLLLPNADFVDHVAFHQRFTWLVAAAAVRIHGVGNLDQIITREYSHIHHNI